RGTVLANDLAHRALRHLHTRPRSATLGCRRCCHPGDADGYRRERSECKSPFHSIVLTPGRGEVRSFDRCCLSQYRTCEGCSAACSMSSVCHPETQCDGYP